MTKMILDFRFWILADNSSAGRVLLLRQGGKLNLQRLAFRGMGVVTMAAIAIANLPLPATSAAPQPEPIGHSSVLPPFPTPPAAAPAAAFPSPASLTSSPSPPLLLSRLISLREIWDRLRRKKKPRSPRGPDEPALCTIAPGRFRDRDNPNDRGNDTIWSDRPLFLWNGPMTGIEVRHLRSNQLMWQQSLTPDDRHITYAGEPLQRGQVYFWRENRPLEQMPLRVTFRLADAADTQRMQSELKQLERSLNAKAASPARIALARISYFAAQELWSDVLRELHAAKDLSRELSQLVQDIHNHDFCLPDPD